MIDMEEIDPDDIPEIWRKVIFDTRPRVEAMIVDLDFEYADLVMTLSLN